MAVGAGVATGVVALVVATCFACFLDLLTFALVVGFAVGVAAVAGLAVACVGAAAGADFGSSAIARTGKSAVPTNTAKRICLVFTRVPPY